MASRSSARAPPRRASRPLWRRAACSWASATCPTADSRARPSASRPTGGSPWGGATRPSAAKPCCGPISGLERGSPAHSRARRRSGRERPRRAGALALDRVARVVHPRRLRLPRRRADARAVELGSRLFPARRALLALLPPALDGDLLLGRLPPLRARCLRLLRLLARAPLRERRPPLPARAPLRHGRAGGARERRARRDAMAVPARDLLGIGRDVRRGERPLP